MDRKGFLVRYEPDLIFHPPRTIVQQEVTREMNAGKTEAVPDSRFRAYAAPMEDGRLLTDYRQSCVGRAPPGTQLAVKQWSIHNADEIIHLSRIRQVQDTGQALGSANTEVPAAIIQECSTDKCLIQPTHNFIGLGIERLDVTPPLFGTFQFPPDVKTLSKNKNSLDLNKEIRYGRNTPTRWVNLYQ
jgi:hypothetical protein